MAVQAARGARAQKRLRAALAAAAAIPRAFPAPVAARPRARAGELKAIDNDAANYQVNTTGTFTLLNGCVQGTDFDERVGRKILCSSVYIRGSVVLENANDLSAGVTAGAQQCRMILFVDMQPNAATPATTDLLKEASPTSQLNLNNRDRFRVLKDKTFFMDPLITTAANASNAFNRTGYNVKVFRRLNIETIYNSGNVGNIGDISSNAIYMFWIGTAVAGTDTDSNAKVSTRLRFTDN